MVTLQVYQYTTVSSRLYSTPSSHVTTVSNGSKKSSLSIELKFQHISSCLDLFPYMCQDYSSHCKSTHWHIYTHTEAQRERE